MSICFDCAICKLGNGCLAGRNDNDYQPATKKQVIERLDDGRFQRDRDKMIKYLKNKFNYEYNPPEVRMIKEKNENPIKEFMKKIGIEETIAYEYLANYTTLIIYTRHPGIWIGLNGRDDLLLKEILKNSFGHEVEVGYKEICGDFITI